MAYLATAAKRNEFHAYLTTWFCQEANLAAMCGIGVGDLRDLIAERAVPGVVYRVDDTGHAWSALAAYQGQTQADVDGTAWFTPASARWLRQATLLRRSGCQSPVSALKASFANDYVQELAAVAAPLRAGLSSIEGAEEAWDAWVSGAYAVCMRVFTAKTIIEKHCRQVRAKSLLAVDVGSLASGDVLALHDDIETLAGIITPFAPFERPNGTPGTVIDRGLAALNLGTENPFAEILPAPLREAC